MDALDGYRWFMRTIARGVESVRPRLPNYDRARAELGGVPWRRFEHTEQWFIATPTTSLDADLATPSVEIDLHAAAVNLKPQLPVRMILGASGIVAGFVLLAVLLTSRPAQHPAASVVAPPAPVVAAAPAVPVVVAESIAKHARAKKVRVAKHHLAKVHHRASAFLRGTRAA